MVQLDDPNLNNEEDFESLRVDFQDLKEREKLQAFMDERIRNTNNRFPKCASWFVNDRRGNQIASAFETKPDINTIGRNYSYRSYFTGFDRDLKSVDEQGNSMFVVEPMGVDRPIIDRPHLSAVFLSKGTSTWKIAFSVPVRDKKENIIGIVACTAEMGKFIELDFGTESQYAALIDGRPGENTGAILEHPFFHQNEINPKTIPRVPDIEEIASTRRFLDPISLLAEGQNYAREWIAALHAVEFDSDESSKAEKNDSLYVLVAEDSKAVFEPVTNLGNQLFWLAIYASAFFVVVALTMWLMVLRMFKESGNRLARSFASTSDSSFATSPEN